jgi:hypothetical protein
MSEPSSSIALDRRSFIKAGAALAGSLIIDFAIPLGECPAFAQTAPAPFAPNAFIRIDRQGVVTLVMPMVEMGQGVYTATPPPRGLRVHSDVGVFYIGLGDRFEPDKLQAYPPGSIVVLPGNTPHFHWAKSSEYVTQVTAIGPLGI